MCGLAGQSCIMRAAGCHPLLRTVLHPPTIPCGKNISATLLKRLPVVRGGLTRSHEHPPTLVRRRFLGCQTNPHGFPGQGDPYVRIAVAAPAPGTRCHPTMICLSGFPGLSSQKLTRQIHHRLMSRLGRRFEIICIRRQCGHQIIERLCAVISEALC